MNRRTPLALIFCLPLVVLLLTGCLEQLRSPRSQVGALSNFFLHLAAGELDDARTYFAPGLVEITPELNQSLKDASLRLSRYEISIKFPLSDTETLRDDLGNGEIRQRLPGRVRLRPPTGQPTPLPDEGWKETDILSARMIERGPGWRLLDFRVECCPPQSP